MWPVLFNAAKHNCEVKDSTIQLIEVGGFFTLAATDAGILKIFFLNMNYNFYLLLFLIFNIILGKLFSWGENESF